MPSSQLPKLTRITGRVHINQASDWVGWVEVPAWGFTYEPLGIEMFFHRAIGYNPITERYYLSKRKGWVVSDTISGRAVVRSSQPPYTSREMAYNVLAHKLKSVDLASYNSALLRALESSAPIHTLLELEGT